MENKKMKLKPKTEELISASKNKINHQPRNTHQSQVDRDDISALKMMNKSSSLSNKAWSMASLMAELPPSPSSFNADSPTIPCDSCRPSTVFYSPSRFQDMKSSNSFTNLKKQFESVKNIGFVEGNEADNSFDYESSVGVNYDNCQVIFSVPPTVSEECSSYLHKRGTGSANPKEFGEAIPVVDEVRGERRQSYRPKSYQDFLDETRSHKQKAEIDAMRKASYTYLLRKLTKKEEAIDEWESNRRKKAELQLEKLQRKLEQKRIEAVQKVQKKLAETQLEAQQKKAKARRMALKEMAKHCSQVN
uniref:Remorin C-terminal domain-containing protein n=2 Tax=Chenopodium quinoa TaxID=63459 RepID=A0A803KYP2_CHEQI